MCICSIKCSYKLNFKHMLHILNSLSLSPTLSISCTLHTHTHSDSKDHLTQITVHKFTAENCSMNFFLVILFFSILEVYSLDVVDTFFFSINPCFFALFLLMFDVAALLFDFCWSLFFTVRFDFSFFLTSLSFSRNIFKLFAMRIIRHHISRVYCLVIARKIEWYACTLCSNYYVWWKSFLERFSLSVFFFHFELVCCHSCQSFKVFGTRIRRGFPIFIENWLQCFGNILFFSVSKQHLLFLFFLFLHSFPLNFTKYFIFSLFSVFSVFISF